MQCLLSFHRLCFSLLLSPVFIPTFIHTFIDFPAFLAPLNPTLRILSPNLQMNLLSPVSPLLLIMFPLATLPVQKLQSPFVSVACVATVSPSVPSTSSESYDHNQYLPAQRLPAP
ncbi:hypothetical protein E2C01_082783 [Portunus trituberculatus]|uniref:Uncharacterized protein n=1 Tax=Portunus trituberculatus TaxID=210409 RepID=A0A5B7J077_PORTR|nr:hypothetical protein [Portunus trituberculatus]